MNLDHLRYFVKLAEVRHYTRAAEQLCISQPSLSHAINQLESEHCRLASGWLSRRNRHFRRR